MIVTFEDRNLDENNEENGEQVMYRTILTVVVLTMLCTPSFAFKGEALAGKAKVTMSEARKTALKARPGTITDEELEREAGGSGLRYSFDVKTPQGTREVGVDAISGRVLENAKEGPNPD